VADSALDKSQAATPHRRQQARDEGQAVQSADLAAAGILIAGLAILLMLGSRLIDFFVRFAQHQLGGESWLQTDSNFIVAHTHAVLFELAQVLAPILGLILLAASLVHVLQTGFLWSPDRLAPDVNRINPLAGLRRIFSLSSATHLGMGLLKVLTVSLVAFGILYARRDEILGAAALDTPQICAFVADIILWTTLKIALALLILGILDYVYQRWRYERQLRMTPQEVREETKNLQGDPQVTVRRRQFQRQLAMRSNSAAVSETPASKKAA
jgi:flagellar biosynthesis protein FlhB